MINMINMNCTEFYDYSTVDLGFILLIEQHIEQSDCEDSK